MRALLISGGEVPPLSAIRARLTGFDLICAADSGLDVAKAWGLRPDIIAGDMDSLSDASLPSAYPEARVFVASRDKDETDTELGVALLREAGATHLTLAGGGGGRLDHLLAVRALLERADGPDEWWTGREQVFRLSGRGRWRLPLGSTVSVFPLAFGAGGMRSEGLRWQLAGLSWDLGTFGVSNESVDESILVESGPRPVLIVLPLSAIGLPPDAEAVPGS